jgi:hypothetical protein
MPGIAEHTEKDRSVAVNRATATDLQYGSGGTMGSGEAGEVAIQLNGDITVEHLERAFAAGEQTFATAPSATVDLDRCTYFDPVALMHLIALAANRRSAGQELFLRLPASFVVRQTMRTWAFPEAISEALGKPFTKIATPDSMKYLGDGEPGKDPSADIAAIQTFRVTDFSSARELIQEASGRWESRYVTTVLERILGPVGPTLQKKVIREALTNAALHPRAALVQAASALNQAPTGPSRRSKSPPTMFTFFVWDNGDSIIETLTRRLESGTELHSTPYHNLHREFQVRCYEHIDLAKPIRTYRTTSADLPNLSSSRLDILLSAIFPGTSGLMDYTDDQDRIYAKPAGMGLFLLVNYVIDVLGGTVSIRTEDYFLKLLQISELPLATNSGSELRPLSAKFVRYPSAANRVQGNMLTIRIPFPSRP